MHSERVLDGRYRLDEHLGSGGMSVVWRAHDEMLDRAVAVKVLAGPLASDPAARARIRAEAKAAAGLWHPHVTNVYDYGEWTNQAGEPVPYVVMELLPGQTLAQRLAAGPLAPRAAMRICAEVAGALAAAHHQDLVHRDVKPSNVMLTPSGAKVLDFDIAALAGEPELDADGHRFGTPAYLAPERLLGQEVLPASDVYALGLLIHLTLANRLPWRAETTVEMLSAHVYTEPEPLPAMPDVPPPVAETLATARRPVRRPARRRTQPGVATGSSHSADRGVLCLARTATVIEVSTTPGYLVTDADRGPAPEVRVVFESAAHHNVTRCAKFRVGRCFGRPFQPQRPSA